MASTTHTLKTYYSYILRVGYGAISPSDEALVNTLSASVDAGTIGLSAAQASIARLAINTTSVGVMSYQFFTGATLRNSGLDYLVSPTGPNPNNLNSAYYQVFNIENRYINFAINLASSGGEGAARFAGTYGALTLRDAVTKAYAEIFGNIPTAGKLDDLLNTQVANGLGGTESRAEYFAYYGRDGLNGQATKAAAIGWLLAQSAKENVGPYAQAMSAYLADLGPDGVAQFHTDLITSYGTPPAPPAPGATIAFTAAQSVSTTAGDPALKSTDLSDTITGTAGVGVGQSVLSGKGADTITVGGISYGLIQTTDGGDTVTIGSLGTSPPILGSPSQSGRVQLTGGNDTVRVNGTLAAGTSITADGVGNSLYLSGSGAVGEGAVSGFQTVYVQGPSSMTALNITGQEVVYVMAGPVIVANGRVDVKQSTNGFTVLKDTAYGVEITYPSTGTQADSSGRLQQVPGGTEIAKVHLDNFSGAVTTQVNSSVGNSSFGFYSVNGGFVTVRGQAIQALELNVDSNSTTGMITGVNAFQTGSIAQSFLGSAYVPKLIIQGVGSLTAQISRGFTTVDATAAGDFNLRYEGAPVSFLFSSGVDTLNIQLEGARSTASKIAFGSGADTLVVSGGFSNLNVANDTVTPPPEVSGFKKGIDHLVLDGVVTSVTPNVQQYADGATNLRDALIQVSSHVSANTASVFTLGADTYIYRQDTLIGVNSGDGLIKLVGVTGVSLATGAAVGDVHYG